jgi:superfamily I DNA/RNA helicase
MLANAIAWRQGGDVAVITPSLQGGYARQVVNRVRQGPCGQQGNGPYSIMWENSDREQTQDILGNLNLAEVANAGATLDALKALPTSGPVRATVSWAQRQIDALGRTEFARADIHNMIRRSVTFQRQHGHFASHSFIAMTVQQAKNREFDGVVVLWPYQVGGDAEHRRRLLYNAITRAKRWCTVIAQSQNILNAPPFVVPQ